MIILSEIVIFLAIRICKTHIDKFQPQTSFRFQRRRILLTHLKIDEKQLSKNSIIE